MYLRYFHMEKLDSRVAHDRLIRKCFIDYDREMALVADRTDPQTGRHELLGVGRLTRQRSPEDAELGSPGHRSLPRVQGSERSWFVG